MRKKDCFASVRKALEGLTRVFAGEETRGDTWRVMFVLLVIACIVGLAMIVVSGKAQQ